MYNYLDYDNDRARVRTRFIKEMNKKTSLKDIGEMLDKFIIDEKAAGIPYTNPFATEELKSASKNTDSFELHWSGKIFKDHDPLKPSLLDDPTPLENTPEGADIPYRDIIDRVKFEDAHRDHSFDTLTPDERSEIALFHSFK